MPIEPIVPKGWTVPDAQLVQAELDRLGRLTTSDVKAYPPWRPWKNPPKTGPRAGGKRTGALGKSWKYTVSSGGQTLVLTVESGGVSYAKWVQGKRQTSVMAGRDWRTIMDLFAKNVPETQKRLAAWARLKPA